MNRHYGPWATGLDSVPSTQLNTFWRRRMALLPSACANGWSCSRVVGVLLFLLAAVAVLAPSIDLGAGQLEPAANGAAAAKTAGQPSTAPTADQANATTTADPSAEQVMQWVYDNESWLGEVDGFLLRMETVQERTEEGRKPLKIPGPFGSKPSDKPLEKRLVIKSTLAWDPARVAHVYELRGFSRDRRTFSQGMAIEEHVRLEGERPASQSFVLDDKADLIFQHIFEHSSLQWGRVARHMGPITWFRKLATQSSAGWNERAAVEPPEGLRLVGREEHDGHECYRIDWPPGNNRYYVRIGDRRLISNQSYHYPVSSAKDLEIKQQIAGKPLETHNDWTAWLETRTGPDRWAAESAYDAQRQKRLILSFERNYDDYRELAPGCWFPYVQRYRSYRTESGESILAVEGNVRIVEAVVNPTLDDELFQHEIPEGANISTDWRYDPPIRYVYSADQTEEDRQQLAAKGRAEREEGQAILAKIETAVDERLGQTPPKLPADGWINSPPLAWQDLRGRAIQLVLWDVGCGPCHTTLDLMQQAAADAKSRGQAYIAVHRHTANREAVEQHLKKHEWTMPVVIDSDGKNPDEPSLYAWLGIQAMPWIVLVNREGEIVGHGVGHLGSDVFGKWGQLWRTGAISPPAAKAD